MCGFVGFFDRAGLRDVSRDTLAGLLTHIRHRGPDQAGIHTQAGFGLAACRLAIRGGDEGDQPQVSADGATVVAFNGELFNWPAAQSDTQALLTSAAAVQEGLELGMGAYARYQAETHTLTLGVDPIGIKPLYVLHEAGGVLWFASELSPLLAHAPSARVLRLAGVAELLHVQRPQQHLPFESLARLERTTRYGPSADRTGPLPASAAVDVARGAVPADPVAAVRAAWTTAAQQAADVAGPASLFLSGGLDSAAVAAWAGRDDLLCLTGRFEPFGSDLDESAQAASIAAQHGLPHQIVDLRDEDLIHDLPAVVRALEVPMMGPGSLALWRMAQRAKAHGKVVLTGTGGDELLGGYARTALALGRGGPWTAGYEALRVRIEAAGNAPAARLAAAFGRTADLLPVLDPDFVASLPAPPGFSTASPSTREAKEDERVSPETALMRDLLTEEREGTLRGLLHVEDRVLAAHGLEGRPVPSLGRVRDLAAVLPAEWLVGPDGEGKRVLREALRGSIPEAVRTNPRKRGFPTPFARAARGVGRDWVLDLMHDQRFVQRGWWNVRACRSLLDEPRPVYDRALWAVCTWETWARLFLDGDVFSKESTHS